jgi:hypothetical protein
MEEVSIPAPWTENNQAELDGLINAPINISNTVYGWFEEQKKRDVERGYRKMSAEEKETLKQRMADIDKVGIGDGETPPPSPTPE